MNYTPTPVGTVSGKGESTEPSAWSALDTHEASEAAGIRALPKPITWTELHRFAEEVARRATEGASPEQAPNIEQRAATPPTAQERSDGARGVTACPQGVPHRWPCEKCDAAGVPGPDHQPFRPSDADV